MVSHRTLVMQLTDGMPGTITADTSYSGSQRCVKAKLRRESFGVKSPFYVRVAQKGKVHNGRFLIPQLCYFTIQRFCPAAQRLDMWFIAQLLSLGNCPLSDSQLLSQLGL